MAASCWKFHQVLCRKSYMYYLHNYIPAMQMLLSPLHRKENWGFEHLSCLIGITQLARYRAWSQTLGCCSFWFTRSYQAILESNREPCRKVRFIWKCPRQNWFCLQFSIVRGSWQSRVKITLSLKSIRPGFKPSFTTWQVYGFREIT